MSTVLTVDPLLFGVTALSGPVMERVCNRFAVSNGNQRVRVPTSANAINPKTLSNGREALNQTIHEHPDDDLIVFGYSQGAQIAGGWLRKYADDPASPSPDRLRFILIGNLERGLCHGGKTGGRYADGSPLMDTPNTTRYRVLDVARLGDRYACPRLDTIPLGKARGIHCSYWDTDLMNPTVLEREDVGNTTYLVVP